MKILQIIPSLHGGGAEKFVIDLSNELSIENEVIICSLYSIDKDMFMTKSIDKNVKIITLKKKLGLDIKIFFLVLKLVIKEKPDVINTHVRGLFYTILAIIFTRNSFFHTIHNIAEKETSKLNQLFYKMIFKYFKVTPISISKEVLKSVKKVYGNVFNELIENGVKENPTTIKNTLVEKEIENYKITSNTKIFLNIGRISYQKNHQMLIDTFYDLIEDGHDIVLLIIGQDTTINKEYETPLKDKIKRNIYLLGMKENISDYLYFSDFFCLSSRYEGLPITLLEAMSMSTIPICTPAGGIPDVIDKNTGFISNDFTSESYKKEIITALNTDDTKINEIKKCLKELYLSKYKIETTAEYYLKLYKK